MLRQGLPPPGVFLPVYDLEPAGPPPPPPQFPSSFERHRSTEEHTTTVSALNRTLTICAKKLHIYDIGFKLKHPDIYDIGGTYTEEHGSDIVPETWFFFSTTQCPGNLYLLNLFVCHRRTGSLSIGICGTNELNHSKKKEKTGQAWFSESLMWHMFRSAQSNENYHIKTFYFSEVEVKALDLGTLAIPIEIKTTSVSPLNYDFIKKIKLNHDFGDVLSKQDKTDFVLLSASHTQYPVHKIFLAAHSPVLRDLIKNKSSGDAQVFLDINDNDLQFLLEFIYTGTIKDILNKDCVRLLQIADKFKLENLFFLTQFALGDQINVENAVDIASIAEHYMLEKLQTMVFTFIKNNPKVLETDGWRKLNDVKLAKKLFQFIQTKRD